MIDLMKTPIYKLPPHEQERYERETRQMLVRRGYDAHHCGLKLVDCPPFKDEDMAISWRIGWHQGEVEDLTRLLDHRGKP